MVLMHVHSFEFHRFIVQEKAPVTVECYVSDACHGGICVRKFSVHEHICLDVVQIRIFATPKVRIFYRDHTETACIGLCLYETAFHFA